jgi:hypothetical protein
VKATRAGEGRRPGSIDARAHVQVGSWPAATMMRWVQWVSSKPLLLDLFQVRPERPSGQRKLNPGRCLLQHPIQHQWTPSSRLLCHSPIMMRSSSWQGFISNCSRIVKYPFHVFMRAVLPAIRIGTLVAPTANRYFFVPHQIGR